MEQPLVNNEALRPSTDTKLACGAASVKHLVRFRHYVLAFWCLAFFASGPFAAKLVDAAAFTLTAVAGTPSYDAEQRMKADFPHLMYQDVEAVLLSCTECPEGIIAPNTVIGNFTRFAVHALHSELDTLAEEHSGVSFTSQSALDYASSHLSAFSQKNPLLSDDKSTALFQFSWEVRPDNQKEALDTLDDFLEHVNQLQDMADRNMKGYTLAFTGPLALFKSALESTKNDLATKDFLVLLVALFIICWRVRSWRLTVLTLVNVGVSAGVSFALFFPVATYLVDISQIAPSIMAFLTIALSIDYSLFLFTRFGEEMRSGKTAHAALEPMLLHSGEVVCLSGSVLSLCYLGVLLFPGEAISTVGYGASLSILMCMATNLTLSPCAIAAFPLFFGKGLSPGEPGFCGCLRRRNGDVRQRRAWFWWGQKVTTWPCALLVPLIAYGIMSPLCFQLAHYQETFDNTLMFPQTGKATDAYTRLQHMSAAGAVAPTQILQHGNVKSNEWFAQSHDWATRLMQATAGTAYELQAHDFLGVSLLPNPLDPTELIHLSWNSTETIFSAKQLLEGPVVIQGIDIGAAYRALWSRFVSFNNDSAVFSVTPGFDHFGPLTKPFINALREVEGSSQPKALSDSSFGEFLQGAVHGDLSEARKPENTANGDGVYIYSSLVVVLDIMRVTYGRLPFVLVVVFGICFLSISLVFRAAFIPLKLCLTIVVPLCMVYGTAVLVYQDGVLDFLGCRPLQDTGGIYWAQPVFSVTVLTGLALDYDIFLFARVLELRMEGYSNQAAVAGAMALSGPTITAAGLIMAAAFGGLLLTEIPANNQMGFLISFSVLTDTFVIRTCLVPAILVLAGNLNYWPRRLPEETKTMADMEKLLDQHAADW